MMFVPDTRIVFFVFNFNSENRFNSCLKFTSDNFRDEIVYVAVQYSLN